jgi:hypothetical protein
MTLDSIMAEQPQLTTEEGAPWPKDLPDPELVKLRRPRPKISMFSSAGLVFLAILFLVRLNPDRKFSGEADRPDHLELADVFNGHVDTDRYVTLDAEPLVSRAVRTTTSKGSLGLRVVPARGSGDRLWMVVSGDGWDEPHVHGYSGRLRKLADLPFASAVRDYAREHPRPVFARTSAVRDGFATGKITTVSGDTVTLADGDRVAFDVVDPDSATIIASLGGHNSTIEAWRKELTTLGLEVTPTTAPIAEEVWFKVTGPGALANAKARIDAAGIVARVEPIEHHYETTWHTLRGSNRESLTVDTAIVPDAQIDLVGLSVLRDVPDDAYALLTDEKPQDYWYVTWIFIALGAIALVFGWALVRAVRRDLLPTRA